MSPEKKNSDRKSSRKVAYTPKFKMNKQNIYIIGGGLVSILLGFLTLSKGMVNLPAILLVLGYCILLPVGILWREKE